MREGTRRRRDVDELRRVNNGAVRGGACVPPARDSAHDACPRMTTLPRRWWPIVTGVVKDVRPLDGDETLSAPGRGWPPARSCVRRSRRQRWRDATATTPRMPMVRRAPGVRRLGSFASADPSLSRSSRIRIMFRDRSKLTITSNCFATARRPAICIAVREMRAPVSCLYCCELIRGMAIAEITAMIAIATSISISEKPRRCLTRRLADR